MQGKEQGRIRKFRGGGRRRVKSNDLKSIS